MAQGVVDIFNPTSFRIQHPPRSTEDYLDLITSEHRTQLRFTASLAAIIGPVVDLQTFLLKLPQAFDLDWAIGVQLDATGAWIGRSRYIPQPLPNMWFSFDVLHKGWDEGYWKGPYDVGTQLDRLDDETYRRLLRAKIMSNNWEGTIPSAQAALDEFFTLTDNPGTFVLVDDESDVVNIRTFFSFDDPIRGFDGPAIWYEQGMSVSTLPACNMRVTVAVAGKIPPIVDLEIFAQDLIPLAIGGVDQEVKVVSVDNSPMFGFDMANQYVSGFGGGAWGVSPDYLVDQLENS